MKAFVWSEAAVGKFSSRMLIILASIVYSAESRVMFFFAISPHYLAWFGIEVSGLLMLDFGDSSFLEWCLVSVVCSFNCGGTLG